MKTSILDAISTSQAKSQTDSVSESCSDQPCGHLARYRYSTNVDIWLCVDCDPPVQSRMKELQIWTVTPSPGWVTIESHKAKNERLRQQNESLDDYWESLQDPMPLEAQIHFEKCNDWVRKRASVGSKAKTKDSKQRRLTDG